jgi:hypothetical protein
VKCYLQQSVGPQATPGMITDITELFSFRHKSLLTGDLNAEHPFWNGAVSNPSGAKLLYVLHINEVEISAQ